MNDTERWHARALAEAAMKALEKNGFSTRYFETSEEAAEWIDALVDPGMRVGTGGSVTLASMGIHERIERKGAILLNHSRKGIGPEEKMEVMRGQLTSDLFLSGINAITLEGELYNVDGVGNRVAALTFGPKKTVVVAGVNKIVRNIEEAKARVELVASPLNNKRLGTGNPCEKTGYCVDCRSDRRICNIYSVLARRPLRSDFTVVIIGSPCGY